MKRQRVSVNEHVDANQARLRDFRPSSRFVCERLSARYTDFKQNQAFHDIRLPLFERAFDNGQIHRFQTAGFAVRPANRPFKEDTWFLTGTTLNPSPSATKSTFAPADCDAESAQGKAHDALAHFTPHWQTKFSAFSMSPVPL